jgi:tRNA/tmRNA/rRNA uracil-C5-methylase (TrmA/RlmC/RlmD family)
VNKCQVTAASLDETGHGVGLAEGIRVHVADLLPGERAEVAIDHTSPHKPEAWGRICSATATRASTSSARVAITSCSVRTRHAAIS